MSFPSFFLLLPLIFIPIIIHLISRKKLKKIEFPTLLFLIKNETRLIRWFRLKDLLLLITRITLLILLISSSANLKTSFNFPDPSEILIIDKSPSMGNFEIKNRNALVAPNKSGIPEFFRYFQQHPTGILFTDAQKNGFSEILRKGGRFPGIRIKKKPLPQGNLGIVGVSRGPAFEGENFVLNFKILNEYKANQKTQLVLKNESSVIEKKAVIIKEGENSLPFNLKLSKGLYALSLEIEDKEGFIFDNKFYHVVKVQKKKNISILSDSYPERLMAAFSNDYFNTEWIRDPSEVKGDLFFVCVSGEKDISDLISSIIPGIFFMQGKTNTSFSNKIPEKISTVIEQTFLGNPFSSKNLSGIPIRYNCLITEGKTIMYFDNGDPFLSEIKNHLLLPVSPEENDFSLHPVFIPFLFSLVENLTDKTIHQNILLDERLIMESSFNPFIIDPEGIKFELKPLGVNSYLFRETKKCGIYKITDGKSVRGLVAVNTHPSESQIESLSDKEITRIFGKSALFNGSSFFLFLAVLCFSLSVFLERKVLGAK